MEETLDNANREDSSKKLPFDDLNREELVKKCKGLLALAQKAKVAKLELQNEAESYKLQLEKCMSEKNVSVESARTLQELVESLTEQKLNYITELDGAQNKIKWFNEKCKEYEEEIAKHKADLIVKDKRVSDILIQLSSTDSEATSLKRQNNRLVEENEQLINQLSELEARIADFNEIGLQQREQLRLLEEKVTAGEENKESFEDSLELTGENKQIPGLKDDLSSQVDVLVYIEKHKAEYDNKIKELTQLYEAEKDKKEKANVKLKSYKDKISKCATCINQLKNTRFILIKTVKEYSESIPKWQNDIIKASKFLDKQINELCNENHCLKEKLQELEKKITDFTAPQTHKDHELVIAELNKEKQDLLGQVVSLETELNKSTSQTKRVYQDMSELKAQYDDDLSKIQQDKIQMSQINKDITTTKQKVESKNQDLTKTISELKLKYDDVKQHNHLLESTISGLKEQTINFNEIITTLTKSNEELEHKNKDLSNSIINLQGEITNSSNTVAMQLQLQIKALESEKASLVREKMNAKDGLLECESQNRLLTEQLEQIKSKISDVNKQYESLLKEHEVMQKRLMNEKESEVNMLKCEMVALEERYELLTKENENIVDLNGLLKDEVDTLKMSLERPRDDDNLSDLNVSLQADIAKLETKLSAYKQENSSLLAEVKESRAKMKEVEAIASDYEESKSKLLSYKTENNELLHEMKEINQVLKERGEAISKLQKAIGEMERLIETLEKDRSSSNEEKENLMMKIASLEDDLRHSEQKTNEKREVSDQILAKQSEVIKEMAEKDAIISTLKEEMEKLRQQQSPSMELPNEDMSTSTISKAEEHARMKDLDDTFEEKYSKLRIFALKLKKKLNETTAQLQEVEQDKARLEKLLQESSHYKTSVIQSPDGSDAAVNEPNKMISTVVTKDEITELQSKVKTLTDAIDASQMVTVELENLKAELAFKTQQLNAEIEAHRTTKDALDKTRRDVKKKSVLSLEMEDYERSMKELTTKMEDKKKKMVQMESTIDTQEGTINAMKTQIKLLEEQIKAEEKQVRLVKEELQHVKEEGNEKNNILQVKNDIISKLEQELEDEKAKNEEANIEMVKVLSDKEKIIISLGEEKIDLNNRLKKMEFKCAELEDKLKITNIELEDLKTEYSSYKVRAQAVLRQNQTVDHSQEEQLKEETAALKAHVELLMAKTNTTEEECTELRASLETERRRTGEAAGEAARAAQRTARLQADLARVAAQVDAERSQHNLQVATLTQCYKAQIADLESKHLKEIEELRKQLAAALEAAPTAASLDKNSNDQYVLPALAKDDFSDGEMDINVTMLPREEGEGSESAPSPPPPGALRAGGARSPVPLERLLEEGVPEDESLDPAALSLSPELELPDLRRKLNAQQQRVKHVTVLLSESERECARYAQMCELLKGEVRRARGSLERSQHAHNAEYMKNVTLKFLTLPPGDERSRLVPVLQKILTLTSEETQTINAVAKGMDPNPGKSWGSYLPWPTGK